MDIFIKATVVALIALVLHQVLTKQDKNIALLLSLAACCMIFIAAVTCLEPVMSFLRQMQAIGNVDSDILTILLKSVGIGLLTEIAALICSDMGNSAIGKSLQIMAAAVIIWISLPLFTSLMELIGEILGDV